MMRRREVLAAAAASLAASCVHEAPPGPAAPLSEIDRRFLTLRDRYFAKVLELYPVVSTYLGGDGWSSALANVNGRLRDWSSAAIDAELGFLKAVRSDLSAVAPATLNGSNRIDHAVIAAQVAYTIHMLEERRYQERCVDTYCAEPFRGVDWQLQQMAPGPKGALGDAHDWELVVERVAAIPKYFKVAQDNLLAGKGKGNLPDRRMIAGDGIESLRASITYFREELPAMAKLYAAGRAMETSVISLLAGVGDKAAAACTAFAEFLTETFDANDSTDRFAIGEDEYRWRLSLLRITKTPAELFEYGAKLTADYQARIFQAAEEVARFAKLPPLSFRNDDERRASYATVKEYLAKDSPKSDEELFRWYRETIDRAVQYGRDRSLFDVPHDYKIDVLPTPAVLGGELGGASYYPAPPFKKSGVGRFYLSPTKNDAVALLQAARADIADTAVHEGFPGHDWNYKLITRFAREISNVRWLTPGEVEGSFSMWEDSMATEGWALYAESLMAEAIPGRPRGFYSPGEYLSELEGQLLRAGRVHVDVGLHTGRLTFDQATDWFLENVSLQSGVRAAVAAGDPKAARTLRSAQSSIYRYSKWPTQAITYALGKAEIERLRDQVRAKLGPKFDLRRFHEEFMKMGSIPPGLFEEELLKKLGAA